MQSDNTYQQWWNKIISVSNYKADQEEESREKIADSTRERSKFSLWLVGLLFILALSLRLYLIFFYSDPQNAGVGWYNDSYHHWQIAYLTKEVGLGHGFLRLWDLQGMEYFWGILQPLVLTVVFTFAGTDIVVLRVMNAILGSLSIALLFVLIKRDFNVHSALAAGLLGAVNPVGIFTDTSGMVEPLSILLLLLGLYFFPKKPLLTGVFWFLASLSRAEHWLFVLGLIVVILFFDKKIKDKAILAIGYFGFSLLYLKYLLDKTGNPIYPIYWNFLGNAAGKWQKDIPLTPDQVEIRWIFLFLLVASILAVLLLIKKRPRLYLFSLLGVGNLLFLSFFVGFTAYLKSYLPRFWVDRIFWLPYLWIGGVISVLLLYFLPKYLHRVGYTLGWFLIVGSLALVQLLWLPIQHYSSNSEATFKGELNKGREITSFYKGGSIAIPGTDPIFTYALYKNGIWGKDLRGEFYDPFFYFTEENPFSNWSENREAIIKWLEKENIKLLTFQKEDRYQKLIEKEPGLFKHLGDVGDYHIYEVMF